MAELDAEKLKENALTSIRLGIEDFQRTQQTQEKGGDEARALSAVRNLFAGILLLFKYKITVSVDDPEDAPALIFNSPEVMPQADGNGGIEWKPVGKFKRTTIDVATIKKRFEGFDIEVDWSAIDKMQECRNHLEHLHPANTLGEVAGFVADLFPVLREFIHSQLNEQPADLLSTAWPVMLAHHEFFTNTMTTCRAEWDDAGVPEQMQPWLDHCQCEKCGSRLLRPSYEDCPFLFQLGKLPNAWKQPSDETIDTYSNTKSSPDLQHVSVGLLEYQASFAEKTKVIWSKATH